MQTALELLLAFVALYPVTTAALWIAGGLMFRLWEERPGDPVLEPEGGWPGVSVLIPAYNEEAVIATSVRAALDSDYPQLEVLVLDDGSTDDTEAAAIEAAAGDSRFRVLRDPVNRGKAEQLNVGFARARHGLVIVTDADTHMHPHAIRYLVARMESSPLLAAVAGAPHVTNRDGLICAMQVLEAAAIIGLIRRTQSLTGRVGVVAGVLAVFRRDRVMAVGGYDGRMATEDIDLTWRLLMAGWQTAYEPRALVGMQVPSSLPALWAQRKRWARGQGEVLHAHLRRCLPLAQSPHVAVGPGVARIADLGLLPAVLARAHRAEPAVRPTPRVLRRRARVGRGDLGRGDPPAHRRRGVALPLRPLGRARDAARPDLPDAVLDRLRQRRGQPTAHGADPRAAGTAGGVGHPTRTARLHEPVGRRQAIAVETATVRRLRGAEPSPFTERWEPSAIRARLRGRGQLVEDDDGQGEDAQ